MSFLHSRTSHRRRPVPLALLYPPIFVAVYLLHITLLRLPYFWDEGGYYIPAAWDFWRVGTLIPQTTMSNAHPPLPSVLLAGWWRLTGFHIYSTRLFICLISSLALLGAFRLARQLAGEAVAYVVLVLTAIYPVWFAQSTLAHADIFAATATLWALSFYVDRPGWTIRPGAVSSAPAGAPAIASAISAGVCFSLAALSKETAIVTPAALFCLEASAGLRARRNPGQRASETAASWYRQYSLPMLLSTAFPLLPLVCWYAYHHAKTGFTFGNPEYLRYNATANLSALRILLSLRHRLVHLTVHLDLFVPVLATLAMLTMPLRPNRPRIARGALTVLWVVLIVHWLAFSVLGGALLTRYLLPAYPIILLLCVSAWQMRTVRWRWIAALSLTGFAAACQVNPLYPFAPEDNLAYRDMVVLHQAAIRQLAAHFPGATVLSAWPVTADLQRPELGYVRQPFRTTQIENFTAEEVTKAAQEPGAYDTAIVFSTKYNPPLARHGFWSASTNDVRYFDSHRDLMPDEVARALGGTVVWQAQIKGQWAALLHFNRSYNASNAQPGAALLSQGFGHRNLPGQ